MEEATLLEEVVFMEEIAVVGTLIVEDPLIASILRVILVMDMKLEAPP